MVVTGISLILSRINPVMKHFVARTLFTFSGCLLILVAAAQENNYPPTLLWKITGNQLSRPSYLYGTIHITDKRVFYFGDSLYSCLEKAEGFAIEINPDSMMSALFRSILSADTTGLLKDAVNNEEFSKIAKRLEAELGVPANKITKKQAWLYSFKSGRDKKPDDMNSPVDTYLQYCKTPGQMGGWYRRCGRPVKPDGRAG